MARPRGPKNRGLPTNLQPRGPKDYFCYRDPRTDKEYGCGTDIIKAINWAIEANMLIYGASEQASLVDRIFGTQTMTICEWTKRYLEILKNQNLKPKTITEHKKYLKAINEHLGEFAIQQVQTKDVAAFLNKWVKAGKATRANKLRKEVIDLFRGS